MSTRSTTGFCLAGTIVVITAAVLGRIDPVFKAHATDVAIVVLALLAVSGLLLALVAPLLPTEPHRLTTAAEHTRGSHHTGAVR
jgi:hypothetical protein